MAPKYSDQGCRWLKVHQQCDPVRRILSRRILRAATTTPSKFRIQHFGLQLLLMDRFMMHYQALS